ncbi:polysaccharide lyase [Sandaracinus amylolyticus]|uniref:polysaccharide lyase n=1 Tax=Sandaracinus amylolyticus TaxID=927083 RepID=UPI001F20E522|nr:polysaccharide lyase [Sandaracinus amylolyticus]
MRALAMTWIAGTALAMAGCVLPPVDLEGRACPCAEGWVCVAGICERGERPQIDAGAPRDASMDAPTPVDAGGEDAGREDAGIVELDAGSFDGGRDAGSPDSGSPDSGPPDSGPPDGGPDLTHCDDLHAGALFCDGFEWSYPAGRINWQADLLENGNVTTVTSPAPFFGNRALRGTTTALGGRAAMTATFTPITSGDLWLRGLVYLPSALAVDAISLLYVGAPDGSSGLAIQTYGVTGSARAATWVGPAEYYDATGINIPRDRWVCLQLHTTIADTGGSVELFVNDVGLGPRTNLDTRPNGGFGVITAGIEYSDPATQGPATLYIDEVVLSRTRVPCE